MIVFCSTLFCTVILTVFSSINCQFGDFFEVNSRNDADENVFCAKDSFYTLSQTECALVCYQQELMSSFDSTQCQCLSRNCTNTTLTPTSIRLSKVEKVK